MRRFFVVFIGLQLLLFGIELLEPVQTHFVLPVTALLAHVCSSLIGAVDANAVAYGKVLMNPKTGFGISIEPGCNGIEACIVLLAAIVAFPSTWTHKLIGLGVGLVAVQLLNIVRVISLFYLGQWNMAWFNFAHSYLWQALIMLDVLVVFMVWARRYARPPTGPSVHAAAA
ncbi:exosortase H [Ramlibacter sp. H39-3-26]|uniref:exosortase H n=1 Tax=Curvibacter soli TaxID=3031331 RepID=UPI0023DA6F9D|nr:exosortase H [Ramlibacter sp. H39-3-26]MDF1483772.1 exosortase H [Ramlibacter sp. H39-3-26]